MKSITQLVQVEQSDEAIVAELLAEVDDIITKYLDRREKEQRNEPYEVDGVIYYE